MVPEFVDVSFNPQGSAHVVDVRTYFNVNGSWLAGPRPPPPSDTDYWQGNETDQGGKIVNVPFPNGPNKITTVATAINFLTYPLYAVNEGLCSKVHNTSCPLAPRFEVNQ